MVSPIVGISISLNQELYLRLANLAKNESKTISRMISDIVKEFLDKVDEEQDIILEEKEFKKRKRKK